MKSICASAEAMASKGPSPQAFTHGTSIPWPDSSEMMWDDDLTESEMDLICAVSYTPPHIARDSL